MSCIPLAYSSFSFHCVYLYVAVLGTPTLIRPSVVMVKPIVRSFEMKCVKRRVDRISTFFSLLLPVTVCVCLRLYNASHTGLISFTVLTYAFAVVAVACLIE